MSKGILHKVEPVRVFEQAVEQIRELIMEGLLAPGERLPTEQELRSQLNVSRASIREALRVLEAEGLIDVRRGAGAFVADDPTPKFSVNRWIDWLQQRESTLEQLLQVRESIECLTISLTAESATSDAIEPLVANFKAQQAIIAKMDDENSEYLDDLARLDAEFHLLISEASGNIVAHEILSHILPTYTQSNKAVIYVRHRQKKMEIEHGQILEAITNRDVQAAVKAIQDHISRVRSDIHQSGNE